jgi:hypothetical protein
MTKQSTPTTASLYGLNRGTAKIAIGFVVFATAVFGGVAVAVHHGWTPPQCTSPYGSRVVRCEDTTTTTTIPVTLTTTNA